MCTTHMQSSPSPTHQPLMSHISMAMSPVIDTLASLQEEMEQMQHLGLYAKDRNQQASAYPKQQKSIKVSL